MPQVNGNQIPENRAGNGRIMRGRRDPDMDGIFDDGFQPLHRFNPAEAGLPSFVNNPVVLAAAFFLGLASLAGLARHPLQQNVSAAVQQTGVTASVEGENVRVRENPSLQGATIKTVNTGDRLRMLEEFREGWYKVEIEDGKAGFVWGAFLKPDKSLSFKTGVLTGDNVNLRAEPSLSSAVTGSLGRGTKLLIVSESGGLSKVIFPGGGSGWVSSDYIRQ